MWRKSFETANVFADEWGLIWKMRRDLAYLTGMRGGIAEQYDIYPVVNAQNLVGLRIIRDFAE